MEYHEHQGQSLDHASNLSGTREHPSHGLSDNETGDGDSSSKGEGEEEQDEDNASVDHGPLRSTGEHLVEHGPLHSTEEHCPVDEATEHHNTIQAKSDHHSPSDPSAFIDVPLEDGIDGKRRLHDVSDLKKRHLPLPVRSEEDASKATYDAEGGRCNDLPLENPTSDSQHSPISTAPPLTSRGSGGGATTPPLSSRGGGATTPQEILSTSNHITAGFANSFLLRPCLTPGPQMPIAHLPPHIAAAAAAAGISPQRPLFMLPPPIAQPFLMLPHHMTQPRWPPIIPLQSALPKMLATDTNFVPFTALTADTAGVSHAQRKKDCKDGREKKHTEDAEMLQTRYKTEYRKTNQASSMLICDKVKLPHKKAPTSKMLNLVDISDGPSTEGGSTGNEMPIAQLVTSHMIQESLSRNAGQKKSGKGKKKTTTSSLTSGAKKKLKKGKTGVSRKETGVSRKEKLDSANQTKQGEFRLKKGKKSGVKKQSMREKSQRMGDGEQLKMKAKKKTQLTPEKILYNKLTQVVKQIAEPNIFSPITLPPNLVIRCSYCDVIYQDRKTLWDHIQTHLKKPVPFRLSKYYRFCRICRKYVSEIRDHIRAVHFDGGTPYGCPKCQERFRYKGLLRNHIQNRHTTARNYMCEICGLAFKQSVTLRKHKMVHTDEKNFFCPTCGKAFKTMYALQKHVVVHAVVKPFRCEICDKQFTQHTNMKSHMRTHTGEKPYQCDVCPMAFTHNVSLKTHKKKQHGIDMWKDPQHAQASKLVASSAPNVKMAIKFIDELSSQAERDQASLLVSNEAKGSDG